MPIIHYMFPRNFPVDGKLPRCFRLLRNTGNSCGRWHVKMSPTSPHQAVVMEFGKWPDTTDRMDVCSHQLVTDLLQTCRLYCGLATRKLPTCYGLFMGTLIRLPVSYALTSCVVAFNFWYILMSHVVRIIQVKVLLRWILKLIVMISLNIHMMTSQDGICVECVTNGLQGRTIWMFTNKYITRKSCIHAVSVRNIFKLSVVWSNIWMFTALNTSALNVESVFTAVVS